MTADQLDKPQNFDTKHLTNNDQRKIAQAIIKVAKEIFGDDASGGGCRAFYTPKEWKERGEKYGQDSKLIVVYDGGDLYPLFSYMSECREAQRKVDQALEELGYYHEPCTGWYSAVYER